MDKRTSIMNKNDISKKVHEAHGGLSYVEAQKIVDFILETIKGRLSRGEKVLISGFGCFNVRKRKEKKGVNPQTGDPVVIPGRNSVKFKPSKYLKII
jgi:nucleoid DNA-binding protein